MDRKLPFRSVAQAVGLLEGCCRSGVRPRTGVFACAVLGGLAELLAEPAVTRAARLRVPDEPAVTRAARLRVPDKEGRRKRCQSIGEEFCRRMAPHPPCARPHAFQTRIFSSICIPGAFEGLFSNPCFS
jgi:hypothetical protein